MARQKNDITDRKFGKLTAIAPLEKRSWNSVVWLCKCECGKTTEVPYRDLIGENTRSCGCLRNPLSRTDLRGRKIGELEVIESGKKEGIKGISWRCRCSCGNEVYYPTGSLNFGRIKSCGCLRRKQSSQLGKNNAIDLSGQRFGKLIARSKTHKNGQTAWICDCDCGRTATIATSRLRAGQKSCGHQCSMPLLLPYSKEVFFDFLDQLADEGKELDRVPIWFQKASRVLRALPEEESSDLRRISELKGDPCDVQACREAIAYFVKREIVPLSTDRKSIPRRNQ
jgi:hypothetical protein